MLGCIPVCEIINGFNIFHAFLLKRTRYLWESYNIISQKVANAYLQKVHHARKFELCDFLIFTESAHWADSVIESQCPSVCGRNVPCEEDLSFHWRGLLHIPPNMRVGCVCPMIRIG